MKKNIYIPILFFLFCTQIFSQSGWFQQAIPTINRVSQIFFINEQTGWICAESLKVYKTTNSGKTWTATQATLRSVRIILTKSSSSPH